MGRKRAARNTQPEVMLAPTEDEWLIFRYQPVSLFSLRMTHATNKGGKTLVVPTPYSFKMALIDAAFRAFERESAPEKARALFQSIKGAAIRFCPPRECVVQNTFVKIRQDAEGPDKKTGQPEPEYREAVLSSLHDLKPWLPRERWSEMSVKELKKEFRGLFRPTIAYREWVFFQGELTVAVSVGGMGEALQSVIRGAASHVSHLGKRGCFWQFIESSSHAGAIPGGFTIPQGASSAVQLEQYGLSQFLDDFGPELLKAKDGFQRISTYDDGDIKLGQHRVLIPTLIPYVRVQATRNFTHYRRNA